MDVSIYFLKSITFSRFVLLRTTIIALRGKRGIKSNSTINIADLDINKEPIH